MAVASRDQVMLTSSRTAQQGKRFARESPSANSGKIFFRDPLDRYRSRDYCIGIEDQVTQREEPTMLNGMAVMIAVREAAENEILSARPNAPVVPHVAGRDARPRTYRTRAALAARIARVADRVAPTDWVPAHRAASSR
jgi:hypothetical protein